MEVGGFNKQVEYGKLGPMLVIASSLILAIRTAKWTVRISGKLSMREWEAECDHSIAMAEMVLSHLLAKSPQFFQLRDVPWYVPSDDDVQK